MKLINKKTWKSSLPVATSMIIMLGGMPTQAEAATLNLADSPLFISTTSAPLNLLVMGRDHKLYYEAYNDHSDLNEDGTLDINYNPKLLDKNGKVIDYFGYFDSSKCYTYSSGVFTPAGATGPDKTCSGQWSGDWLNYVTTSRMDALRKVLYGGYRSTDDKTATILERAFIPQDAHSWGKSYESIARDGYDITKYTDLPLPDANSAHLFANTTLLNTTTPLLRYVESKKYGNGTPLKIWHWLSVERPVAGNNAITGITSDGKEIRTKFDKITDLTVRVQVCASASTLESNCRAYTNSSGTTTYKPAGLLQQYGESGAMKFGLLSGSYQNNLNGGVLRKGVGSITDEIDQSDGTFITTASGIIKTLNNLKITGFGGNYEYSCGWKTTAALNNGACQIWGNPIAEMMYEGLRYFAGKSTPTNDFKISAGAGEEYSLNLPVATWNDKTDPYKTTGTNPNASCAKPFETVISDINPSYDTDKVPGSAFSTYTGDLAGLNASTLGQTIWNYEFGAGTEKTIFIGEVGANTASGPSASAPTAKEKVSSFGNIRGLAPEEPTKQGGYYAASVAYYGNTTDINSRTNSQKVATYAVALASPLPRIEIPVNGKTITLVPFAKSVDGGSPDISHTGNFQPTNQIVDFYVDTLTSTYGKFRINYEDVEQGADHDMDAIAIYEYTVKADNTVDIKITSEYAAGGIVQHMGYVISGTSNDGTYLEVLDRDTTTDVDYELDTPPGQLPGGTWKDGKALPFVATRNFSPGSSAGAELLKDPLWYAAKYGGFQDNNENSKPDVQSEWDVDGDGTPDNYFLVTNALKLGEQLAAAFDEILANDASASSATVNAGSVSSDSRVYQAKFNGGDWAGHLLSYEVYSNDKDHSDGSLKETAEWDAADNIPAHGSRKIFTMASNNTPMDFEWTDVNADTIRKAELKFTGDSDSEAQDKLNYLRGDTSNEVSSTGGKYRKRAVKLGDIVNSAPLYVGPPAYYYSDTLESASYSAFRKTYKDRTPIVIAGANDGMFHAFSAKDGSGEGGELFAYVPGIVFKNLKYLTSTSYTHRYFVDGSPNSGDVFFDGAWHTVAVAGLNHGGQGIYAIDITDPNSISKSNVLWEFTDTNDSDLGYTYSQPAIVRLHNGKWAAVFGNGYNSAESDSNTGTGSAVLYIVDIKDGTVIKKFDTKKGSSSVPNGLATPTAVDEDGDDIIDYIYAGDLLGNLWKVDVTDKSSANWKFSYSSSGNPAPLYSAKDGNGVAQPITTRAEVVRGPKGVGMMLLFGTGKWLEATDKIIDSSKPQTFYGIYDANVGATDAFSGRAKLQKQSILAETKISLPDDNETSIRVTTDYPGDTPTTTKGWYLDLIPPSGTYVGERVVSNSVVRENRVVFTTLVPQTDPCTYGGDSWLMEMDALTGSRLTLSPYDVNRDGKIDSNDYVTITVAGEDITVPVTGLKSDVGITQEPGVLTDKNKDQEYKYMAGSSGEMQVTTESTTPKAKRRQSWRQLK